MPSRRIVDASPLILLAKANRLELLRLDDVEVVAPVAVIEEIGAKGGNDPVARMVAAAGWIVVTSTLPIPEAVRSCRLGRGESAVLSLARDDADCQVIIDDRAGRGCARRLGIACVGTFGLVLLARRLELIPAIRPTLNQLRSAGLYLDDQLVAEVLASMGE